MIREINKIETIYISVTPDDLRQMAEDVQRAFNERDKRGHVRSDNIIIGPGDNIEIVFMADIKRMREK